MQQKAAKCMFKPSETLTALITGKAVVFSFSVRAVKMGVSYLQWSITLWPMSPPPTWKKKQPVFILLARLAALFSVGTADLVETHRACSLSFSSLLTFFRCCLFLPLHYTLSLGCHEVISECTVTGNKCVFVCVWCEIHVMWSETLKKKSLERRNCFFTMWQRACSWCVSVRVCWCQWLFD